MMAAWLDGCHRHKHMEIPTLYKRVLDQYRILVYLDPLMML